MWRINLLPVTTSLEFGRAYHRINGFWLILLIKRRIISPCNQKLASFDREATLFEIASVVRRFLTIALEENIDRIFIDSAD